eukprot:TRINITY_DN45288_c0_g1_i1.p1 TRINITY_DN45288_c0_g1~~TRINITY_DN45288_c0_g1_i1.p1  ORF type:complete len:284 (+),score=59.64 TRINITY_DN45288_c0_g1_i1:83-853(+)
MADIDVKALQKEGEKAFARMEKVNAEFFALTYGSLVTQVLADLNNDIDAANQHLESIGYNMGCRMIDEFLAKYHAPPCRSFRDTAEVIAKVACPMFLGVRATVSAVTDAPRPAYTLSLEENPLVLFSELPDELLGPRAASASAGAAAAGTAGDGSSGGVTLSAGAHPGASAGDGGTGGTAAGGSVTAGGASDGLGAAAASPLSPNDLLCGMLRGALEMVFFRADVRVVRDMLWGDSSTDFRVELEELLREEFASDE